MNRLLLVLMFAALPASADMFNPASPTSILNPLNPFGIVQTAQRNQAEEEQRKLEESQYTQVCYIDTQTNRTICELVRVR